MYAIQSLLIILIELFCCKLFFEIFSQKRVYHFKWMNGLCFGFLVIFDYVIIQYDFIFKQILVIIVVTFFMYLYFEIDKMKALVLVVLFQGLLLAVDYLTFVLLKVFMKNEEAILLLIIIMTKATLFICVLFLKKYFGYKPFVVMSNKQWLILLSFPVMTICTIAAMILNFDNVASQRQINILFIIASALTIMNIIEFYLINDILKKEMEAHENKLYKAKVENQLAMYYSISENLNKHRKKAHEYKNQITCIEALILEGKQKEVLEYINKINGNAYNYFSMIDTNHIIVNAILNTKYQEAVKKDILFILKVNDLSRLMIEDADIVIILSNLINNAIEACEKSKGDKIIKLKFIYDLETTILSVKNTYEAQLSIIDEGYRTTKEINQEEHGIGLKNIIEVLERYSGSYVIKNTQNEFYVSIIFPNI